MMRIWLDAVVIGVCAATLGGLVGFELGTYVASPSVVRVESGLVAEPTSTHGLCGATPTGNLVVEPRLRWRT